jgi:PAS domain S-box-containing protein
MLLIASICLAFVFAASLLVVLRKYYIKLKQYKSNEALFRLITENSHDLICLHNPDSTYTFLSPSVKSILGYESEEMIGKNPYHFLHGEDLILLNDEARKKSLQGEKNRIELRFRKKNGEYTWLETFSKPILENGIVTSIQTTSRDISYKKEFDKRLSESELKYRLLADTSNDMIMVFDAEGKHLFASPAVKNVLGYTVEDWLEQPPFSNVHPEDHVLHKNIRTDFAAGRRVEGLHFRMAKKDGEYIWVEGYYTPILENNKIVQIQVSLRDISVRQKALQKLAESEELYRLLASNSNDLVCLHNKDGTYQYVSPSVFPLLGYRPEELIGESPYNFFMSEDREWLEQNPHRQTLEGQHVLNVQYRFRKKDGGYIWLETYTSPVTKDGVITSFQTSSRDITERKLLEESLQQAKQKAERASRYKSDFLSSMSHEIRTPLNAIVGLSDVLLRRNPNEGQLKIFKMLKNAGDSLLTLVNDILDLSKIEAGKMDIDREAFNCFDTLDAIVKLFEEKASVKELTLQLQYDKRIPHSVMGDQQKLRQVISNLVSNAIKFTVNGSITVRVEWHEALGVQFAVADTGIGIEEEHLQKIFETFEQADESTTRKNMGTGLGLPISKKLVELMQGSLYVASEVGKGSTFYFTIPLPSQQLI